MRRKRIVNLTLKLARASLAVLAMSLMAMFGWGGEAIAAETPAPQVTLYKDSVPSEVPELKPYGTTEEKRATVSFGFHVTTTNVGSYGVYLSTPNGNLVGTDASNTIPSMSGTAELSAMLEKTWGWRYGSGTGADEATAQANATAAASAKPFEAPKVVAADANITTIKNNAAKLAEAEGNREGAQSEYYSVQIAAVTGSDTAPDTYSGKIMLSTVVTPLNLTKTMQTMKLADCPTTATAFEDERDHKKYLVQKLKNNAAGTEYKCWMVQNLALESNTSSTKKITAYNASTKTTFDYYLPASSTTFSNNNNTKQMFNGSHKDGQPDTAGCNSATSCTASGTSGTNNNNSGAYYSWLVATAQDSNTDNTNYKNVPTSICPKGWTLPSAYGADSTVGTSNSSTIGQFQTLYNAYGSASNFKAVWAPSAFAGYFDTGGLSDSGTDGYWWSSTIRASTRAYFLGESASNVNPTRYDNRYGGFSVRCVLAS